MSFIRKHQLLLFFIGWFLLNLFQAAYTELLDDEAYYWIYSKFLAWGYYDHPPMIAVLIRMGGKIFPAEAGVRLFIVIVNTLTLLVIYKLLPRKNDRIFYALACSIAVLQVGGFIAVPDLPLCFFVASFFLAYRHFLSRPSIPRSMLLGLMMALMLYSKYHGVLIIIFTLLSNPRLFRMYQAYIAVLVSLILFFPHLYWQFVHDYPSLQYHLRERNAPGYKISFTVEYIVGQILLAGPIVGWLVLWSAFRYKTADRFERALKFSLVGFYVFFLISSLRGRVEANWTIPAFVPLFILAHQYLLFHRKEERILMKLLPLTLLLVALARIYLVMDTSMIKGLRKDEFHQNRRWARAVQSITGGLPAVFTKSYQDPSKYWFYTGVPAFGLNTTDYRRNNFNFWPVEDSFMYKKVALISWKKYPYEKDSVRTPKGIFISYVVDSFYSFSKVKINCPQTMTVENGKIADYPLTIISNEKDLTGFSTLHFQQPYIEFHLYRGNDFIRGFKTNIALSSIKNKIEKFDATFEIDIRKGNYLGKFAIPSCLSMDPTLNSSIIKVEVK